MDKTLIADITAIRLCVGFLGEKGNHFWWPSAFFSSTSEAFLKPTFNKTFFSTQYYGVKGAATIVHDEYIGIGKDVFHLFRLPEHHEMEIHSLLGTFESTGFDRQIICDKDKAHMFLQGYAQAGDAKEIGPVKMGEVKDIAKESAWKRIAYQYAEAFKTGNKVFPYFSTTK